MNNARKRKKRRKLTILQRQLKRMKKYQDHNSAWETLQIMKLEKRVKNLSS
ncbi:hypothetical protein D3C76_222080 [compost metagenome]